MKKLLFASVIIGSIALTANAMGTAPPVPQTQQQAPTVEDADYPVEYIMQDVGSGEVNPGDVPGQGSAFDDVQIEQGINPVDSNGH